MQNQTFSAILFLYQQVLEIELDRVEFLRAQRPERLSAVLAVEVRRIHAVLDGVPRLVGELLYGGGLGGSLWHTTWRAGRGGRRQCEGENEDTGVRHCPHDGDARLEPRRRRAKATARTSFVTMQNRLIHRL